MVKIGCTICGGKEAFEDFCKTHFIEKFEDQVYSTIEDFDLIKPNDKITVAVSGGKDSITILYLLSKKYNVTAIAVDEGIKGYREKTLKDLRLFCSEIGIKLKIASIKEHFGKDLDEFVKNSDKIPCTMCGVARRYILNLEKDYDVIATGHNLDDEAQSIMMNLMKHQIHLLARSGPKSGISGNNKFVQRIKPLYFCTEKEVMAYTLLKGWNLSFNHCPYADRSFRANVRDLLNEIELLRPGFKKNLINNFIKNYDKLKNKYSNFGSIISCKECGSPTSNEICKACELKEEVTVS